MSVVEISEVIGKKFRYIGEEIVLAKPCGGPVKSDEIGTCYGVNGEGGKILLDFSYPSGNIMIYRAVEIEFSKCELVA